jgi:L-iditol 2-dehydrogenase
MEYRDVPVPSLEPGHLLLKTRCALICGSDLEYLDGIHGEIVPGLIRGHEFVADVVEIGEGVTGWEVGDRAVPISFTDQYGAWADYFVSPRQAIQKVPDNVPDEAAVFVEPMHTGFGAVEASSLKPGRSGAIIGAGKIGLLAVMSAKVVGAAPIMVTDIAQDRLDKALEFGADVVFNAAEVDVVKEIRKYTTRGGHPALDGPHSIIVCARQGKVLDQALRMGRQGCDIILAGFIPVTEFDPAILLTKQLVLSGIMAGRAGENRNNGRRAVHMLAHKQLDPTPMISETMPFKDIQKAIDSTYSGENLAVLLKP